MSWTVQKLNFFFNSCNLGFIVGLMCGRSRGRNFDINIIGNDLFGKTLFVEENIGVVKCTLFSRCLSEDLEIIETHF